MPIIEREIDDPQSRLEIVRAHVRILIDLGRLAAQNLEVERFLDQATMQVARAVNVDHVKILEYRPVKSDLLMIAGVGWREGVVRTATFASDLRSAPGRCFKTGEPLVIADVTKAPDLVISPILTEHGIQSLVNVPLMIEGAAWGVLEADSSQRRDFGLDTVDFMIAAAAIIGASLQRRNAERAEAAAVVTAAAKSHARDVLLREMQHRVKNNFQMIIAAIAMQKRRVQAPEAALALDRVADRINAISLAHDQLAPEQDSHNVNAAAYLASLCSSIEQQTEGIAIELSADELHLSIDRAVALGLILNEAVTNSIKHAFGDDGGRIAVTLEAGIGYGEARLVVADNGRGIQQPQSSGSGLRLISSLSRQIGGRIEQTSSSQGTRTVLLFPVLA